MSLKQLAERMGVQVKQLDFELDAPCKDCKKMGGFNEPCESCEIAALVRVRD